MVTASGVLIGLGWVARDEIENPKWFGVPRATGMGSGEIGEWNKQFGPKDENKWAVSREENQWILDKLDTIEQLDVKPKKETW